jgi:hypothetical protein
VVERPLKLAIGVEAEGPPAVVPLPRVAAPDRSKRVVEAPVRAAAGVPDPVAMDTAYNRQQRYVDAARLVAAAGPSATPRELRNVMFSAILHVPLDDPFLGLAPWTPGGEGGRVLGGLSISGAGSR